MFLSIHQKSLHNYFFVIYFFSNIHLYKKYLSTFLFIQILQKVNRFFTKNPMFVTFDFTITITSFFLIISKLFFDLNDEIRSKFSVLKVFFFVFVKNEKLKNKVKTCKL
jgi:hypothetical protein